MSVYFITGKLGSGKGLAAVHRIFDHLNRGCRVATNIDLYLEPLVPEHLKVSVIRVPDHPRVSDLELIGRGSDSKDEKTFGALVLDELGTWFNRRAWQDKGRQAVIDWCLHARKLGWHVYFIVQDLSVVDNQLSSSTCEHLVVCRRLDRFRVPLIGRFLPLHLPKYHVANVYYGDSERALRVERWWYTGKRYYASYDTNQSYKLDCQWLSTSCIDSSLANYKDYIFEYSSGGTVQFDTRASYSLLPPHYTLGRGVLSSLDSKKRQILLNRKSLQSGNRVALLPSESPKPVLVPSSNSKNGLLVISDKLTLFKSFAFLIYLLVVFGILYSLYLYYFPAKSTIPIVESKSKSSHGVSTVSSSTTPSGVNTSSGVNTVSSSTTPSTSGVNTVSSSAPQSQPVQSQPVIIPSIDFSGSVLLFLNQVGGQFDFLIRLKDTSVVGLESLMLRGYFAKPDMRHRRLLVFSDSTFSKMLYIVPMYSLPAVDASVSDVMLRQPDVKDVKVDSNSIKNSRN